MAHRGSVRTYHLPAATITPIITATGRTNLQTYKRGERQMPKYLDVAAEANVVAQNIMQIVREETLENQAQVAEMIARLVNLGIRCSPRGVQHTVRLNAVRRAVQGLPIKVSMEKRTDERTKRTYNALVIEQTVAGHYSGKATVEAPSDEE